MSAAVYHAASIDESSSHLVHGPPLLLLLIYRMMVAEPSAPQFGQLLAPHPKVKAWMAAVRDAVGADMYDEAHAKLMAAVQRLAATAAKPSAHL